LAPIATSASSRSRTCSGVPWIPDASVPSGLRYTTLNQRWVSTPLDVDVCLVQAPWDTSPYGRTFTVEYLGNVWKGGITHYLNVEINFLKDMARRTVLDGEPVWLGCDKGKIMRGDAGI